MSNEDDNRTEPMQDGAENAPEGMEDISGAPLEDDAILIAPEEKHLKTKTIPAIVMLIGGLATAIMGFIGHMDPITFLSRVLIALFVCWIIGGIAKMILDKIVIKEISQEVLESVQEQDKMETGQEQQADKG